MRQLLSWTTQDREVALKPVTNAAILASAKAINDAVFAVYTWIREDEFRTRPTPPPLSVLKPVVRLFGFDPYIGELYRGMVSSKKIAKGSKVSFQPEHRTLSWTTNPKIAKKFAYSEDTTKLGYVVRLNSSELQVWNSNWFLAVLNRVAPVLRTRYVKDLQRWLTMTIHDEDEVLITMKAPFTATVIEVML